MEQEDELEEEMEEEEEEEEEVEPEVAKELTGNEKLQSQQVNKNMDGLGRWQKSK